ncbi:MAG: methyl-accepting chemotaxis protein [Planctomycetota bacterium]|jgi:methyl-accepting chemotaxis protein
MSATQTQSASITNADFQFDELFNALENIGTNVFIANADLEIVFVNKKAKITLQTINDVLVDNFGFGVDEVLGKSIDVFHKNPSYQRNMLNNPANLPHQAEIALGELTLDLNINPIFDENGEYTGTIVNWEDITAKKAAEAEAEKVTEMMRQLPLNVMLCNSDLELTYMNETSFNTLKSIEHNLPVKAADMIGTCIDVFHVNPAHQRQLLANPRATLPYKTEIVIGGEDIELQADGVWDSSGEFLGCMASWTVITEQKKLKEEQEAAQKRDQERAADLQMKVEQLLEIATAAGSGDLTREVPFGGDDAMGQLAGGFQTMIDNISSTLRDVAGGTNQIEAGSSQIASASQDLSEGAARQAANLEEISSSLEEITSMTSQNAENARQAAGLSEESQKSADRGQNEMNQMTDAMNEINQSSTEISKIIKVIDEIAFQTNLLALNAAVEAARAGEAGKGFAVVAEEVRNLAQRSAEAAKNTSAMIEESSKRSANGVQIASRVGEALEEIVTSTNKVNTLLGEIASASQEQADGVGQINKGVSELDKVTQQNAGNSEELASAAEETSAQVTSLRDLVGQFQIQGMESTTGGTPSPAPTRKPSTPAPLRQVSKPASAVIPMDGDEGFETF